MYLSKLRAVGLSVVLAGLVAALPISGASAFDSRERSEIEQIVRDYLLERPEIILEAMQILRAREEAQEADQRGRALSENRSQIFDNPETPIAGNPNGDVTVVEFFDYQCGYCKAVRESLLELLDKDRNVRLVLKEFPILGPASTLAARAALASRAQDRYWEFHNALMEHRGRLNENKIMQIAGRIGLDTKRLKQDMTSPGISSMIESNLRLAETLAIRGTPAFIIGDQVVPGAIDLAAMRRLIEKVRNAS